MEEENEEKEVEEMVCGCRRFFSAFYNEYIYVYICDHNHWDKEFM